MALCSSLKWKTGAPVSEYTAVFGGPHLDNTAHVAAAAGQSRPTIRQKGRSPTGLCHRKLLISRGRNRAKVVPKALKALTPGKSRAEVYRFPDCSLGHARHRSDPLASSCLSGCLSKPQLVVWG